MMTLAEVCQFQARAFVSSLREAKRETEPLDFTQNFFPTRRKWRIGVCTAASPMPDRPKLANGFEWDQPKLEEFKAAVERELELAAPVPPA